MPVYKVDQNPHRICYGTSIGILRLNTNYPLIPGVVGNASTFNFPVIYRVVEELDGNKLVETADPSLSEPIIKQAQLLERDGVSAITSDCGYMALFQNEVASSVKIPVFLSSLMQIPFITNILQPNKKIGVIVANSKLLRGEILTNAGISSVGRLVIGGMEEKQGFLSAIWNEEGVLDTGLIEKEVVEVATFLVSDNPDIGAILLECSDLPPYAAAVKQSLGLPVFDFISMINFVYSSLVKNSYIGTMY